MDAEGDSDIDLGDEVLDRNETDTNESSNIIDTDPAADSATGSAVETLPPPILNGPQNDPVQGTTLDTEGLQWQTPETIPRGQPIFNING